VGPIFAAPGVHKTGNCCTHLLRKGKAGRLGSKRKRKGGMKTFDMWGMPEKDWGIISRGKKSSTLRTSRGEKEKGGDGYKHQDRRSKRGG